MCRGNRCDFTGPARCFHNFRHVESVHFWISHVNKTDNNRRLLSSSVRRGTRIFKILRRNSETTLNEATSSEDLIYLNIYNDNALEIANRNRVEASAVQTIL